jgi:hypothetical protein
LRQTYFWSLLLRTVLRATLPLVAEVATHLLVKSQSLLLSGLTLSSCSNPARH